MTFFSQISPGWKPNASSLLSPAAATLAQDATPTQFAPNSLVVSKSVYGNEASNMTMGEILPPNCALHHGASETGSATAAREANTAL